MTIVVVRSKRDRYLSRVRAATSASGSTTPGSFARICFRVCIYSCTHTKPNTENRFCCVVYTIAPGGTPTSALIPRRSDDRIELELGTTKKKKCLNEDACLFICFDALAFGAICCVVANGITIRRRAMFLVSIKHIRFVDRWQTTAVPRLGSAVRHAAIHVRRALVDRSMFVC